MESKRYLYINKYFAFAFMVFAVLSSVSDKYDEANAASQADWNLAYFLEVNNIFIQSSANITAQIFINKFNDFSVYVQGILAKLSTGNIFTIIALGILFFDTICMNNKIMQNNIWRKVVF
jgi:hypothetical protein